MDSRRIRVEFIRFSLLVTLTIALVSVAVRHGGSHATRSTAAQGRQHAVSSSPSGARSPSSPARSDSSGASSPAGTPSALPSRGGGGGGGTPVAGPVQTLPNTGSGQAVDLAACAAVLIAAGSLSVTLSRRAVR